MNKKIKNFRWYDIWILKLCVVSCVLMLVVLIPVLTQVDWKIYAGIFVVTYVYVIVKMLKK
jgi:uncharacterized membrane protein